MLPLIDDDQQQAVQRAEEVLKGFSERFDAAYLNGMRQKLGLSTVEDDDAKLVDEFLSLLAKDGADFTLAFRRLSDAAGEGSSLHNGERQGFQPGNCDSARGHSPRSV